MPTPLRHVAESNLPKALLDRASLAGNEYAWRIEDIPNVIEAARQAGLVNVGGQLQFRLPATCECYWVQVDTYKSVPKNLPWDERVARAADTALADFKKLALEYDFIQEGRRAFDAYLQELVEQGGDPIEKMWFVWYVLDSERANRIEGKR